jgi:adenylate cyclase
MSALFVSIIAGLWCASLIVQHPIESSTWSRLIASSSLLAFALAFMLLPIFKVMQLLSLPTLLRAMMGQYLHPRTENRGILFMDLKGSTKLIGQIGDKSFLRFLNEILFQINGIILNYRGEIYRYVGDEFIITWSEKNVQESLDCVMAIQKQLRAHSAHFKRRFGCQPEFRFGMHFGSVLVGELGDLRSEIALIGDAIHTTKRIEDVSRHFSFDVLASDSYLERVSFPEEIRAVPVEAIRLRGKTEDMQLFGIAPRDPMHPRVP